MSGLLNTIVSYIPHSLMRLLLAPSYHDGEAARYTLNAAVLFADVSGFSKLTDALVEKGDEGAEEITRLLNNCFGRLIEELEAEGGDVVKFSGDALTVLFAAEDEPLSHSTRRALQAAEAMQRVMKELAESSPVELGLKIGIGAGEVWTFQVGGVFRRWEYVLTGPGIMKAFAAEGMTERGGITVLPESRAQMHPSPLASRPLARPTFRHLDNREELEQRLVNFVPGAVRSWMVHEELHDWLGVLRTMSVLFIGLEGISYESEESLDSLHNFLRNAQKAIYRYQGSINKLVVDDKGTIFMVLFGAPPFAHADSPLRAVRCALDLQGVAKESGLQMRTGVTTGRVFAGPVGSDLRREYTVMGQAVNLAARLMGKAPMGSTFCDPATFHWTQRDALFDVHPPTQLKGLAKPIPMYEPQRLTDRASSSVQIEMELVGRNKELAELLEAARSIQQHKSAIRVLEGEAGLGKTRLLHEMRFILSEEQFVWLKGEGESLESLQSYRAWKRITRDFFGIQTLDSKEQQQAQIQRMVEGLAPELLPRLPLLNDLLGLQFPETEITETLESSLRPQALGAMLFSLLERRAMSMPVCLVIEDLQWLDSLSWELVHQFVRALRVSSSRLFLLLTLRPQGVKALKAGQIETLKSTEGVRFRQLSPLSREALQEIAANLLRLTPRDLPQGLKKLLHERASGNPLYVQEWLRYLQQKKWLTSTYQHGRTVCHFQLEQGIESGGLSTLPDSLEGVLLARIDTLSPELQLVLKVASVIGRQFPLPLLQEALQQHSERVGQQLEQELERLVEVGLLRQKGMGELAVFRFQHLLFQEVSYRSLLYKHRRELHQFIALWLENKHSVTPLYSKPTLDSEPTTVEVGVLPTLVQHWSQAGQESREFHYVCLAAKEAAHQYANTEAIRHYTRALELVDNQQPEQRFALLLAREELWDILGDREQQLLDLQAMEAWCTKRENAEQSIRSLLRRAAYEHAVSDYEHAIAAATRAHTLALAEENEALQADALHARGLSLLHKGEVKEAENVLQQSLSLAQSGGEPRVEASSLRLLGILHAQRGEYANALENFERVQVLLHEQGQQSEEIKVLSNIGLACQHLKRLERAVEALQEALNLCRTIGARSLEGRVLANLASTFISEGDFGQARHTLLHGLQLSLESGSRSDECGTYMYLCENSTRLGLYNEAVEYGTQFLELSKTIGHRYFEGYAYAYRGEALMLSGNTELALTDLDKAIEVAESMGETSMKMDALVVKAHLQLSQGLCAEAQTVFQEAARSYEEIGFQGQALESTAGQAFALWKQQQSTQALETLEPVLQALKTEPLFSMLEPFRVYLLGCEILRELAPERAEQLRQEAMQALEKQARRLEQSSWRHSYLHNIPHHKALQSLPVLSS